MKPIEGLPEKDDPVDEIEVAELGRWIEIQPLPSKSDEKENKTENNG